MFILYIRCFFCINGKFLVCIFINILLDTQNQNEFHCTNMCIFLQVTIKHYYYFKKIKKSINWKANIMTILVRAAIEHYKGCTF